MCSGSDPPDLDRFFTVFQGSSPEDVCHARQLWSSLSLLPPLESRLVSADIRQRLPVSGPSRPSGPSGPSGPPSGPTLHQRQEERRRYEAMADQRKEILALLRRQREQRIRRELLSLGHKPSEKSGRVLKPENPPEPEDEELVQQLQ